MGSNEDDPSSQAAHLFDREMSRRTFLKVATGAALALSSSSIPDLKEQNTDMVRFPKSQLGLNIHLGGIRWAKQDVPETIDRLFSSAVGNVRIPLPFDEVHPTEDTWSFKGRDWLFEKAVEENLLVDLQIGIKTIGWPEVHAPSWLADKFPYLREKGIQLDKDPEVQKYILEYIQKTMDRYAKYPNIRSIHVENEPFSKRLAVSNYRFLSPEFNVREVAALKKIAPDIPVVQNIPIDTPEAMGDAIALCDIAALNLYPQHNELPIPQSIFEPLYWKWIEFVTSRIRAKNKPLRITEMQVTPWLAEPFSLTKTYEHLRIVQDSLQPEEGIVLWDPYLIQDNTFISSLSEAA